MTTVRKNADAREKEIRLAIFRIERGRSHTQAKRLTISAVAREAGVSSSLLPNHYPSIAEEIRTKQGASSRQKLDAKQDDLSLEREKTKALRTELVNLRNQVAKLASINAMLQIENRTLAIKCGNPKITNFPLPGFRVAVNAPSESADAEAGISLPQPSK
ncbi:MAG: tetR family transcriptional regulator-like protein [Massilia sp.]|nr:tetR family transcriptional regulator-like protein [Massilia sp.]